jgi:hypothetical protein
MQNFKVLDKIIFMSSNDQRYRVGKVVDFTKDGNVIVETPMFDMEKMLLILFTDLIIPYKKEHVKILDGFKTIEEQRIYFTFIQ